MKILHVSYGKFGKPVPAVMGGAVQQTIEELSTQHSISGEEVIVICMVTKDNYTEVKSYHENYGVNYKYCIVKNTNKISMFIGLIKIIKETVKLKKIDIVHLHVPQLIPIYNLIKKFIGNPSLVWHVHNTSSFSNYDINKIHIVGVSKSVLVENGIDMCHKNVSVIHNIGRNEKFSLLPNSEKKAFKSTLNIKSKFIIGFIGRISQEKGLDILISSIEELPIDMKDNITLIIIGSSGFKGEKEEDYLRKLKTKKLSFDVNWIGYVDNWELQYYYNTFDVFVVPSIWKEPAGQVILEAQLCGTKVIASNKGGIPEYLSPYETSFDPHNVTQLGEELKCQYKKWSQKVVDVYKDDRIIWVNKNFSVESISKDWLSLYRKVINKNVK